MSEADPLAEIVACLKRHDLEGAEAASREALSQHSNNPRAWHLSGIVHAQSSDFERAVECFRQAIQLDGTMAHCHYNLGLANKELGRLDQAIEAYRQAIAVKSDFLEARNNLANALMLTNANDEAIAALSELVVLFPANADSHYNLANLLQDTGNFDESVEHYQRSLELDPDHSAARENLGRAFTDEGLDDEAKRVWQAWLEREPNNAVAKHMVAATCDQSTAERCESNYVRETFNQDFAKNFESQLARLGYQAPQLLSAALNSVAKDLTEVDVLDAGCGTGLCGPLVRGMAKRLIGIDLSGDMLAEARKRGDYDELIECEITRYLSEQSQSFDIIICADTLCYFGNLLAVLAAAGESLRSGGWLVFTVEDRGEPNERGFQLMQHGRFCHTEKYVQQTLLEAGFSIKAITHATLRKERGKSVEGLVVTASRESK
jgi:predicted TPR repeat methyltransferase